MGRVKRVQKTRPVTRTRIVEGVAIPYTDYETYWDTEYVSGSDSYGSSYDSGSYDSGSSGVGE